MKKDEIINQIIDIEWEMFSSVHNVGGPADCQTRPDVFRIMRKSQYEPWSVRLLESWLGDLAAARDAGRNLASEKYARMMEKTFPEEYSGLADALPAVDPETQKLIDGIVSIHLGWKEEVESKYPNLSSRGRPATVDLRHALPSMATYLKAELQTYSPETIRLYHAEAAARKAAGQNEAEENLLAQAREYGYADLAAAEAALAQGGKNA